MQRRHFLALLAVSAASCARDRNSGAVLDPVAMNTASDDVLKLPGALVGAWQQRDAGLIQQLLTEDFSYVRFGEDGADEEHLTRRELVDGFESYASYSPQMSFALQGACDVEELQDGRKRLTGLTLIGSVPNSAFAWRSAVTLVAARGAGGWLIQEEIHSPVGS